ncbi:MAG: hypothetical protein LBQ69_00810 [Treponema sp.]|jgi:YD repeat-containing protein|nr:hypothetical protein [Treponema sp.]
MRKIILLFIAALIVSTTGWAQTGRRTQQANNTQAGGGRDSFMTKQSVFFEDGSLDEYTTYQWDPNYSRVDNEVRYSASGSMLEQIEFAYNEDRGYITTKITRDVESRLKNRVVYQYNAGGRLWRESIVDNRGRVISTYEYGYDDRGNRTSRIIRNRAGDRLAETIYTFDAAGRMTASETRDFGNTAISSTRYTYDAQGNLVSQQVLNSEGRVTTNIRGVWENGREVRNEMLGANGDILLLVTSEYGQDGEMTKRTVDNIQGQSKQFMEYEYTYRPRR